MSVKLLIEHHLEFLSLKGGCTGSSESTLVKMPHCWKSQVMAQMISSKAPVVAFIPILGLQIGSVESGLWSKTWTCGLDENLVC